MDIQFTEKKLIEIYSTIDDLYKAFIKYQKRNGHYRSPRGVAPLLSGPEVATILVNYHYSGYKCFEYYYRNFILKSYNDYFPSAPQYEVFLAYIPKTIDLVYLWLLYSMAQSKQTGLYFIDSKKLQVCHLRREKSNKVFKGIARKGKTSTGWFYGLKLHLVINNLGEIVSFDLTTGNVADNNQELLKKLLGQLDGICVGDKGYLSKLFTFFYENGLHLLTKPRKNMKNKPVSNQYNFLINKRAVVESTFDILMTVCDIEHSRHRSPINAIVHILSALVAYQHMDMKPRVLYPSLTKKLMVA